MRINSTHALWTNYTITAVIIIWALITEHMGWPGALGVSMLAGWSAIIGAVILWLHLTGRDIVLWRRPIVSDSEPGELAELIDRCTVCGITHPPQWVLPNLCAACAKTYAVYDCPYCEQPWDGEMGMELADDHELYQVACLSCGYMSAAGLQPANVVAMHNHVALAVLDARYKGGAK